MLIVCIFQSWLNYIHLVPWSLSQMLHLDWLYPHMKTVQLCIENMKYCLYFFLLHNDAQFILYYVYSSKELFFRSDS